MPKTTAIVRRVDVVKSEDCPSSRLIAVSYYSKAGSQRGKCARAASKPCSELDSSILVSGFAIFAVWKAYELQRRADKLRARYRRLYPETKGLVRRLVALLASSTDVQEESIESIYNVLYTVQEVHVLYNWLGGEHSPDTPLMAPYPPETGFHPWRYAAIYLVVLSVLAGAAGYELTTAASFWDLIAMLLFLGSAAVVVRLELQLFRSLDFYLDRLEEGLDYLEKELRRLP